MRILLCQGQGVFAFSFSFFLFPFFRAKLFCLSFFLSCLLSFLVFFRSQQLARGNHIAVGPFRNQEGGHTTTCCRAIVNGELLESLSYTRNQNRNNYTVRTKAGFALVDHFFMSAKDPDGALFCSVRDLDPALFSGSSLCPTITAFTARKQPRAISASDILQGPLVTELRGDHTFIVELPHSPDAR